MAKEDGKIEQLAELDDEIVIGIVGAGGIGSNLMWTLVTALHRGQLIESLDGIHICIYDSDIVSESNLAHQRFSRSDIGMKKVYAISDQMSEYRSSILTIEACGWDVRQVDDLHNCDLVIVAVDSHQARRVVHNNCRYFLDLRCLGDGYVAIDDSVDRKLLEQLTPDQESQSCQFDGAIESGNIQFGYLLAAAHGAQWILQSLRIISGDDNAMRPDPQTANITFGTAGKLPQIEYQPLEYEPREPVTPMIHPESELNFEIDSNNHGSIKIRETLAAHAINEDWKSLWDLADSMRREVSLLFDSTEKVWVDVGTAGRVAMSPPLGSIAPYKLWLHTHPRDAYWSKTDTNTLTAYTPLLDMAYVLGHDHMKIARNIIAKGLEDTEQLTIESSGPLSQWTDEDCLKYKLLEALN